MMTRKDWLRTLAQADNEAIKTAWQQSEFAQRAFDTIWLREPEIGLLPLQARMGNSGDKFLFGDATMTRAVVQINHQTGYSFVIGRDKRCAEICAIIDALMQDAKYREAIITAILTPLATATNTRHQTEQQAVKKTKVDFFTMVRGE